MIIKARRYITFVSMLFMAAFQPVLADGNADYNAGVEAYKGGNYKVAAQKFHGAVAGGFDTPTAWLYLGHSYNAIGDTKRAAQVYKTITAKFSGKPEAKSASQSLNLINRSTAAKSATNSRPETAPPATKEGVRLIDRITICPPQYGHEKVRPASIETVKEIVRGLPPHIAVILEDGGTKITLAPNIIDVWPGDGDPLRPGDPNMTMGEEPMRTYNHDIYIYEREKIRGSSSLKEPRSALELRHSTLVGLGHAVNDCAGKLSEDSQFMSLYKIEVETIPAAIRSKVSVFNSPGEVCAELIANLLGGKFPTTACIAENMPKVKQHCKNKLRL